ncbi:multidrug resistance-associated protein 4-like [Trematomus bernacchii]|uniref:multidrug resistance-associated protein 4-like n=1 Tax=Trematomus bernacchii TaxID=40690 RepID=UPI00146AC527|nr:multidrug resistance-associated protein 4-like [Trematomus bernacchii]
MMPVQTVFGKLFGIFRSKTAVLADNRIRIMNEVVSGIRIIKMYAWEKPFSALVTDVRSMKLQRRRLHSQDLTLRTALPGP